MCLGEEARALRCLGGLDWLNSQCPISPTGPMSSGTKAASCWRFLLTGQKLLESSRLPAPTPTQLHSHGHLPLPCFLQLLVPAPLASWTFYAW